MAQKRRGLGRGLQALIPEAQKEKVSASRPSDVFFPESRKDDAHEENTPSHAETEHADPEPEPTTESRSTRDLTATLLAPSQRKRGSKSRSTRSTTSRRTAEKDAQETPVSRETTPASATTTRTTEKKTGKKAVKKTEKASTTASTKRAHAAGQTTRKRAQKKTEEATSSAVEASTQDDETAVNHAAVEPAPETVSVSEKSVVSRETEDEQISEVVDQPSSSETDHEVSAGLETDGESDAGNDPAGADASDLVPVPGARFAEIPVNLIHPNPRQPRQVFDEEDISELAASIAEVGLLQPIVVRQVPTLQGEEPRYELIMGERRLRASKEAGLETIPAVVRDTDDVDLLRDALLENLHRVQLNPLEEAAAYQQLLEDFQCTHAELSERIARSRSQISNTLRLMKLPPLVQRRLAANVISAGHARALLGLPNAAEMERLAQRVVAEGLSVRATEELVALHEEADSGSDQPKVLRARSTPLPALSTRLSDAFDTRVKVTRGAKKGRITIEFAGDEDLARIVGALAPGTSLDEE